MSDIPNRLGPATIEPVEVASIIGRAQGFVAEYDGVINSYQGCSFGCDYCYAANFASSPADQENWGRWVLVKANAVERLARLPLGRLNDKTYYMSTATDPYQPVERQAGITRDLLEVMCLQHPRIRLVVQTRSPLVIRDLDLFKRLEASGGRVQVNMTITTDDDAIRRIYEPGCPSIQARLQAIGKVHQAGIQSCITLTPLLPLRDTHHFVEVLLGSGVSRFIVQGFHQRNQGRGGYVAVTDAKALVSTAVYYGCGQEEAVVRYQEEYRRNLIHLRRLSPIWGRVAQVSHRLLNPDSVLWVPAHLRLPARREGTVNNEIELRPEVQWFAEQMELRLRANDHKGGWQLEDQRWLSGRLGEEWEELKTALWDMDNNRLSSPESVISEAADVGNFAMMIADNTRKDARFRDGGKAL